MVSVCCVFVTANSIIRQRFKLDVIKFNYNYPLNLSYRSLSIDGIDLCGILDERVCEVL